MSYIKFNNLELGYGNKKIIKNLSLSINEGEYIYIIGENGVGKSTLIKGIINLIKPLSGNIQYDKKIKKNDIGYLPQLNTSMQNFPASVYEIVLSGTLNSNTFLPKYSSKDKGITNKILHDLDLCDIKNKSFKELSGGQQRRVLLARAMSSTSKILVMDEPVAGLDPKAMKNFYELIKKLNKEKNITIIIVSHDIKAAIKYADKVLHLHEDGYCYGTVKEYKKNMISEYFLDEDN